MLYTNPQKAHTKVFSPNRSLTNSKPKKQSPHIANFNPQKGLEYALTVIPDTQHPTPLTLGTLASPPDIYQNCG